MLRNAEHSCIHAMSNAARASLGHVTPRRVVLKENKNLEVEANNIIQNNTKGTSSLEEINIVTSYQRKKSEACLSYASVRKSSLPVGNPKLAFRLLLAT